MNEKLIELKLRLKVKALGGKALKFTSPYERGMPDRIILMPDGKTAFAEIKTTGKKPTALQQQKLKELRDLGFRAEVIDSNESLTKFINSL